MRLTLVVLAAALAGCATIFTGTTDKLHFEANVPNVRLTVDGEYLGELPLTVDMSRNFVGGRQFVARFERPGYATQEFKLKREFNAVAVLDITSLVTSGGVDVLTGSLMKFSPTEYRVQMLAAGQRAASAEFRRAVAVARYALASFRQVQRDLARGGGDDLAALAWVAGGGDPALASTVAEVALRHAAELLPAATAGDFVERLEPMLASALAADRSRVALAVAP
jgi:hypothetical protein